MILKVITILLVVLNIAFIARGEVQVATSHRYYYHLPFRESPYEAMVGIHEAKQNEAIQRNHFRFSYDKQGRVIEVAFMRNGKLVINTSHDNFFMLQSKIAIEYNGDKEQWSYYNFRNERITNGPVYKAEYTLDKKGNRVALSYYDERGQNIQSDWDVARYVWEKLENGVVKENRYNLKGEQVTIRPGFDFYEVQMTFDKNGYVSILSNYGLDGKPTDNSTGVAYDKLVYSNKGDFMGWKVFNKNNQPVIGNYPLVAEGKHTYNEFGDNLKTETFDLQGSYRVASWGYAFDAKLYDVYGNIIEHHQYDQNKNLMALDGRRLMYARTEYNDCNQVLSTTFMDKDRKLVSGGTHRSATVAMKYDDDFRLIEVSYKDPTDKLVESSLRGNAIERYSYSSSKIDTTQLDAELKTISHAESKVKKQLRPLSYMVGNWQRSLYFANGPGGWAGPAVGESSISIILNGRFLDEFITNPPSEGEKQISRNSLGLNPETGLYRLIRLNGNSLGNMSVYNGKLENGKLVFDNLNDIPEGVPALRFIYSRSDNTSGFEQLVDQSLDKGKTWTPLYRIVYRKV